MFIGFDDGSWIKALYNDESCSWEANESDEIPDINRPLGDSKFYYPYKQYLPEGIKPTGDITEITHPTNNVMVVSFSNGLKLVLSYDIKTENEHIEVST